MTGQRAFWGLIAALALGSVLCIFCVDQPVALFWAAHRAFRHVFQLFAAPSLLALPLAGLYLVWAVWRRVRSGGTMDPLHLAMSMATLAGTAAKDELKWMFGRPWPDTWLQFGTYAFHPFIQSVWYGSFPSGHTTYISAPLGVLWAMRPRLRLACGAVIFLVMLGLVCAGYHFVGDVLAGLATGLLCAWGTLALLAPRRG